jgi:precorrin-2/cobalt-factor-2 C20-methyltransferase
MRLRTRFATTIVPGVTGMCGAWSAAGLPMTWGDDVLVVAPGTLPLEELIRRLERADGAAIMKIGRNLGKVRAALRALGMLERAIYVERATMTDEVVTPLVEKRHDIAPYFAMVLVPGEGRRP